MKRWVILGIVCLAFLGVALVGCKGRGGAQAEEDKSITIWWAQWAPADGLAELGKEFQAQTGIQVTVHQIPWKSYQDQVFLNFGSNRTDFDVVVGDSQWLGRGATRGLYLDLTDWLGQAVDLSKIHPNALKYLCEYPPGSGRYYAAPCETDAIGFVYRKDWFEDEKEKAAFQGRYKRQLKPPDTWEDFRDIAEFFTRPAEEKYGCTILSGRGYDSLAMGFQCLMWSFGGSWGDEKTYRPQGHLNGEASVAGLTFMKQLMTFGPKNATISGYDESLDSFKANRSAMTMLYFAFFPGIVEKMPEKVGFFLIPRHRERRVVSLGGQGFSISRKTTPAKQQMAKQFIAWFNQKEIQEKWITKPAGFTAHVDVLAGQAFRQAAPYNAAFAESLNYLRDFWNVPVYNELLAAAQQCVGEALDGKRTPREALDELAKRHEKIFRDAGLAK